VIDWTTLVAGKLVAPRDGQTGHSAWGYRPPVTHSSEMSRVLNLPRRALELDGSERAEAIIDRVQEWFARPVVPGRKCRCAELDPERHREEGCIERLRLPQAQCLREISICGGSLGPIGVGHGKTLIDLLGALAFQRYDANISVIVLMVPPGLATQLEGDYAYYGQHFKMPQIVFHGIDYLNTITKMDTRVPLERGSPTVHVVPYSRVSRPEATSWLERELKPHAIIADEAHKLRNIKTATGARVYRYMEDVAPHTKLVALSGSMTAKKIQDYWHLAKWALRGGSPLPVVEDVVNEWGTALNPSDNPAVPGRLMELCEKGEHLYAGFKRRIAETVGVVTTAAPSVDVTLVLDERPMTTIPPLVLRYLRDLRAGGEEGWTRPDGEQLLTALEAAACAMQIACGFYYRFIYPDCEFPRDEALVEEWRATRKLFHKAVRKKLKNLDEHMDSPRLVMNAAERFHGLRPKHKGLPTWDCPEMLSWYKIHRMVRHDTEAVCFDDFLVRDAIAWANEHRGVIWYEHDAFGEWVSRLSGLPKYGGGKPAKKAMMLEDGSRSIICSIKAHGTGTNGLQHRFHEALTTCPMADPNGWEQHIGRLHRPGQNRDVNHWFYRHTEEMKKHVTDALSAAYYVESTGFGQQKIVKAFSD
jgi:hypothetical protein